MKRLLAALLGAVLLVAAVPVAGADDAQQNQQEDQIGRQVYQELQ